VLPLEEKQRQEEEEEDEKDDDYCYIKSLLFLCKYDEFAAEFVAAENKKKSKRKLKRLVN
jgi:hypothetical protein